MARQIKKTAAVKSEAVKDENVAVEEADVLHVVEEAPAKTVVEKRKFEPTDVVNCESITAGQLIMIGAKSGEVYKWNDIGDVTEVEYRDLVAAVRASSDYINKPYFLIKDDDFLAEYPKVVNVYNNLYSARELKSILRDYSPSEMKAKIESLPDGAKRSIQNLASTMIQKGQLDSVNKIQTIDEIFDTKLMLLTGLFN